jgi:hypothetical protein
MGLFTSWVTVADRKTLEHTDTQTDRHPGTHAVSHTHTHKAGYMIG